MRKSHRNSLMINLETAYAEIAQKQHDGLTQKQHMRKFQDNSLTFALKNSPLNASRTIQLNYTTLCGFHKTAYVELYWKTA